MILNRLERIVVNNPVRVFVQRHAAQRLLQKGGSVAGGRVLEIGCGSGQGMRVIRDVFAPATIDGFDLDPEMVALAQHTAGEFARRIWQGDAAAIDAEDATYDAVFDFGIIHHVPDWQEAVAEVHRVLRPGGRFFVEEVLDRFILHPIVRRVFEHPMENRFGHEQFAEHLERAGFEVTSTKTWHGYFGWYTARKSDSASDRSEPVLR